MNQSRERERQPGTNKADWPDLTEYISHCQPLHTNTSSSLNLYSWLAGLNSLIYIYMKIKQEDKNISEQETANISIYVKCKIVIFLSSSDEFRVETSGGEF